MVLNLDLPALNYDLALLVHLKPIRITKDVVFITGCGICTSFTSAVGVPVVEVCDLRNRRNDHLNLVN